MDQLDPNVQVALVSVFATFITTLGVIAAAVINNRKERTKAADAGVEAGLDEKDVLSRILSLISEIEELEKKLEASEAEKEVLRSEIRKLRAEVTLLRLGENIEKADGESSAQQTN